MKLIILIFIVCNILIFSMTANNKINQLSIEIETSNNFERLDDLDASVSDESFIEVFYKEKLTTFENNTSEESFLELARPEDTNEVLENSIEPEEESSIELNENIDVFEESEESESEESDIHLMEIQSSLVTLPYKDKNVYNSENIVITTIRVFEYTYEYRYNYLYNIYQAFLQHKVDCSIPAAGLLAQAYNEGGGGRAGVYLNSNNCFGIKANSSWEGKVYSQECYYGDGKIYISYKEAILAGNPPTSLYRVYTNINDSVKDYIEFIQENYKEALWKNSLPCSSEDAYNTIFNYLQYTDLEIKNSYLGSILWNGYGEKGALNNYAFLIKKFNLYNPAELKEKIKE